MVDEVTETGIEYYEKQAMKVFCNSSTGPQKAPPHKEHGDPYPADWTVRNTLLPRSTMEIRGLVLGWIRFSGLG